MSTIPAAPTEAGVRVASHIRGRFEVVVRSWRVILQTTVAASGAYLLARAIGHEVPFFAPIAAVATVAVSLAQRLRRASELLVGNALGILFADLLIGRIGPGVWQLGLVVAIALVTAILAGGGPILIMQASSAAILIATLTPPTPDQPYNTGRFIDALIGGGVGLLVSALLMPPDPARTARAATAPLLESLADGYRRLAAALAAGDPQAASALLDDLRATNPVLTEFQTGLATTRESVRLAPWYWGQRTVLAAYALAGFHLDNALRNLRVLARHATIALDRGEEVPPGLVQALEDLAHATALLDPLLDGQAEPEQARDLLSAIARWSRQPPDPDHPTGAFGTPMKVQIRLSTSDLLQATGLTAEEAAQQVRTTAP